MYTLGVCPTVEWQQLFLVPSVGVDHLACQSHSKLPDKVHDVRNCTTQLILIQGKNADGPFPINCKVTLSISI